MTKCGVRPSIPTVVVVLGMLIQPAGWTHPLAEFLRVTPQSGAAVGREVIEYLDLTQFAFDIDEWWQPLAVQPGAGRLDMALEASPDRFGFDLRGAQLLSFGEPPGRALLVRASYDPARVHAALRARGFEATTDQGIDRYLWGEDCATNLAAGDDGDLFAGRLGVAVRLALLPGVLAGSCSTAVSDDVLAAHAGATLSLFDAPSYRELAAAAHAWDEAVLAADSPARALFVRSHRELADAALEHGDPAQALFLGPGNGASLSGVDPAAVFAARLEVFLPDRVQDVPYTVDVHLRPFERHGETTAVVVAVVRFGDANTAFRSLVAGLWQRDFAPLALP